MRKTILAAVAATIALGPIAVTAAEAAPLQRETRTVVRERPNGTVVRRTVVRRDRDNVRNWRKGQRFERRYARNYRVVDYRTYRGRGLYAPPRGYRWVQSGNDAVLVAITSGLIGAVLGGALR